MIEKMKAIKQRKYEGNKDPSVRALKREDKKY